MRVLQPFDNLVPGFWPVRGPDGFPVCFPDLRPESDTGLGWVRRIQSGAPPIRKSLEPGAFRGRQSSYRIALADRSGGLVIPRR